MPIEVVVPRETKEFLALTVLANDLPTGDFETSVVKWPARPSGWVAAEALGTEHGVIIDGLAPGTWTVWVRVPTAAESVVVHAGTVYVA